MVAGEEGTEIGDYGYGGEDSHLMDDLERGGFGEVLEDERSTTDEDKDLRWTLS